MEYKQLLTELTAAVRAEPKLGDALRVAIWESQNRAYEADCLAKIEQRHRSGQAAREEKQAARDRLNERLRELQGDLREAEQIYEREKQNLEGVEAYSLMTGKRAVANPEPCDRIKREIVRVSRELDASWETEEPNEAA